MIFIDIGGWKGNIIDKWIQEDNRRIIFSLEPNEKLYKQLKLKYTNFALVFLEPIALWNKTCIKDFFISQLDEGSSFHREKKNLKNPKKVQVYCKRATEFINEMSEEINQEIFLYLNCEGAEFEIMEDLIESGAYKKIKEFEIAFHHQPMRLDCFKRYEKLIVLMKEKKIKFKEVKD